MKVFKIVKGDAVGHYTQDNSGLKRIPNTKNIGSWYGDMPTRINFCLLSGFSWGQFIGGYDCITRVE